MALKILVKSSNGVVSVQLHFLLCIASLACMCCLFIAVKAKQTGQGQGYFSYDSVEYNPDLELGLGKQLLLTSSRTHICSLHFMEVGSFINTYLQ